MKRFVGIVVMCALLVTAFATEALARDRTQARQHLRDGSCRLAATVTQKADRQQDQLRQRDRAGKQIHLRLWDGFCLR
ncbi:MAG: hypothetical protein ACUVRC_03700 [Desulfotomaculales bacterium]